jgi:hypothetical protein
MTQTPLFRAPTADGRMMYALDGLLQGIDLTFSSGAQPSRSMYPSRGGSSALPAGVAAAPIPSGRGPHGLRRRKS